MKPIDETFESMFKGLTLLMLCYMVSKTPDISSVDIIFKLFVLPISFVWGVTIIYIVFKKSP